MVAYNDVRACPRIPKVHKHIFNSRSQDKHWLNKVLKWNEKFSSVMNELILWTVIFVFPIISIVLEKWETALDCHVYLMNASLCPLFYVCVRLLYMRAFTCVSAGSAASRAQEWAVTSLCFGRDAQTGERHIHRLGETRTCSSTHAGTGTCSTSFNIKQYLCNQQHILPGLFSKQTACLSPSCRCCVTSEGGRSGKASFGSRRCR